MQPTGRWDGVDAMRTALDAAVAYLRGDEGDRSRFADMHRRFAAAPFFGIAVGGTTLLTSIWAGWRLVVLVVLAAATMAAAIALARRIRALELLSAVAFVLLEANLALSVLCSGGWHSPLLPLMVVPVFTQAVCFRPGVTPWFVGYSVLAAVAAVVGAETLVSPVTVPPVLNLVSFAALSACLALAAHWLASSDLRARDDAVVDELTGLLNRKALYRRFSEFRAQAVALGADFSVVLCDVDRFKAVNDVHGHDRGDEVLRELADRLRLALRTSDLVYRFGGEEILVLLPGDGPREALAAAERIRSAVSSSPLAGLPVTVSAGVASAHGVGVHLRPLIEAADRALYAAKDAGRDRVCAAPVSADAVVTDGPARVSAHPTLWRVG